MNNSLKAKALYFLARREYAYQELYSKLKKYSEDEEEIKSLLDFLRERGWLSEERYIKSYLDSKSKKYGILKIKYALTQKTSNSELVNQVLSENPIDEYSLAYKLWLKKFGAIATERNELAKQIRFLQNKGFSFAVIKKVIDNFDEFTQED